MTNKPHIRMVRIELPSGTVMRVWNLTGGYGSGLRMAAHRWVHEMNTKLYKGGERYEYQ